MNSIPNPPTPPSGMVAKWNGTTWEIVPLSNQFAVPPKPEDVPSGYQVEWDGSQWVVSEIPQPPVPPAPTPDQITSGTINNAVYNLQIVAYLTTTEMEAHITPESKQEVTDYIHQVANILAVAQQTYGTGVPYAPDFPPLPTALPQVGDGKGVAPYIQFIVVN